MQRGKKLPAQHPSLSARDARFDAEALHLPGEHDEHHDEVHRPVLDVLELPALDR
jgi:hypothetical protein